MRAALDETLPELGVGIAYVVAATIVVADDTTAKAALAEVVAGPRRKRPFHWHLEGERARKRMIECLVDLGAVAHVVIHYPTGRKKMELARAMALRTVVPCLVADGVDDLVIESRDESGDRRDKNVILDVLNEMRAPGAISYDWQPKTEPMLWLADGVCGAVRAFLLGDDDSYYTRLRQTRVIDEPIYLSETLGPLNA